MKFLHSETFTSLIFCGNVLPSSRNYELLDKEKHEQYSQQKDTSGFIVSVLVTALRILLSGSFLLPVKPSQKQWRIAVL